MRCRALGRNNSDAQLAASPNASAEKSIGTGNKCATQQPSRKTHLVRPFRFRAKGAGHSVRGANNVALPPEPQVAAKALHMLMSEKGA